MSRVATIFFAYRVGLWIEPEAKFFRFLADVLNDTAFFLELGTPYLGSLGKVIVLSVAEALKALCGVAAGASKAALSMHFAKHDNLAELNAKEASQETAVGLVGLLAGSLIVKVVEDRWAVLALMVVLVFAHLYMNYLGVRAVCMRNFNRQRAMIFFYEYARTGTILSPEQVAQRETLSYVQPIARNSLGVPVARIEMAESYFDAARGYGELFAARGPMFTRLAHVTGDDLADIKILAHYGATPQHILGAWFAAMSYAWRHDWERGSNIKDGPVRDGVKGNKDWAGTLSDVLCDEGKQEEQATFWAAVKEKGWNLDSQLLEMKAPVRVRLTQIARKMD